MANTKDITDNTKPSGVEKAPFFMPEKLASAIEGRPDKIQKMILDRSLDHDDLLPEIPSAQVWKNFTEDERDSFINAVEKVQKWSTYERTMKAHWPPIPKARPKMRD